MTKVLDAGAMINSDQLDIQEEAYTTPSVMEELKTLESRSLAETARLQDNLRIIKPREKYLKKVKKKAEEIGSLNHLSRTDKHVLALALEKNAEIVTDDYTLQNLAAHLEIDFQGVIRGEIKEKRRFKSSS